MTTYTAPFRLNLGPNSPLLDGNGKPLDLSVFCGADWQLTVPFFASDGVTAVNLTSPQMQIRASEDSTSALLLTPNLSVTTNAITISIPAALTKNKTWLSGAYDLFATRTDTSTSVPILTGSVKFVPSITVLT